MRDATLNTARMGGTWRAVLVGRSNGKVFGTRLHVVKGQPRHGYDSRDGALEFCRQRFGVLLEGFGEKYLETTGDGQFISAARLKTLHLEPVVAGGVVADTPEKAEWRSLPTANLYAAGMAAKAYVEKTLELERVRQELDQAYAALRTAVGDKSADLMIAGIRSANP